MIYDREPITQCIFVIMTSPPKDGWPYWESRKKIIFVKVSQLEKNKSRPGLEAKNEVRAHLKSSMYQTQTGITDEVCIAQQRNS